MKIVLTKYALGKFKHLSVIKLGIKRGHIKKALQTPDYFAEIKERGVKFVLLKIDDGHDLRVIYREDNGIITIVIFYPAERGRYES